MGTSYFEIGRRKKPAMKTVTRVYGWPRHTISIITAVHQVFLASAAFY
jgi:hypothetical protein